MRTKILSIPIYQSWRAIIVLMLLVVLTACAKVEPPIQASEVGDILTPITTTATNEYHQGQFIWHDLLTPDAATAQQFYAKLFGWSFESHGRYSEITHNGKKIGGMLEIKPKDGEPVEAHWLPYMSVPDVDVAADFVKQQGGVVIKGPLDMQQRGRGALVADPQGAQLVLLHAIGGDPADTEAENGGWLWNEIWTNVPAKTLSFYNTLGNYDEPTELNDYLILENDGRWRAGIRTVFEDEYNVRWVPTIKVANPKALVEEVAELGGVVWVTPEESETEGDTALISDSTGALFMIQRWPTNPTNLSEVGQ